ncbi:hypothetical protein [Streptomyces europaeiscabiei]|uniref:hypothetical protein n=1 Tax=Streptomyces europaeiscabiei TaxID=146819 RepID=UPI0029AC6487|nr:hypothetical protein [Streptomyces europaeiscabiei]MDX3839403.1 hypothetical protein [Streptomyces europaeiscabiei]
MTDGWIELALAEENPDASEYENLIRAAREFREQVFQASAALEHAQAVVYVEGPHAVTGASVHAAGALTTVVRCFHAATSAHPNGEAFSSLEADYETAHKAAHDKYLSFLYAASDALGEDLVQG